MPPWRREVPLEYSLVTRPVKHMKPGALLKRRKSPTSATMVTAEGDAAQHLEGGHERQLRALLGASSERRLQAPQPLLGRLLHRPVVLEDDLGRGLLDAELPQPRVVAHRPRLDPRPPPDPLPEQA